MIVRVRRMLLAVLVALAGAASLAAVPPAKTPGPSKIYLRHPNMEDLICGQSSTGWSCRPTAAVVAWLLTNGRDDCGP